MAQMDHNTYSIIIQSVCNRTKVEKPTQAIIRNVITFCKKLDVRKLQERYPDKNDFMLAIVDGYLQSIKPLPEFDFNEHLQKTNPKVIKKVSTTWLQDNLPKTVSKAMSVYFDTRLRHVFGDDSSPITRFGFTIVPRTMQSIPGDGNLQVRVLPSQITYFKLGPFAIPYTVGLRSANFMKELTMTFTAITSNGILANERTYHFAFTYTVVSDAYVVITPVNTYCKFCPPLRYIDDVSIVINDPIIPVQFPIDRMTAVSLNYLSTDGRITFPNAHGLATGDVVIVQTLTTLDDSLNATILAQINNPRGLAITVINPTVIAIGIDFTTIISPDTASLPTVIFFSKTFRFPMEIGYQDIAEMD